MRASAPLAALAALLCALTLTACGNSRQHPGPIGAIGRGGPGSAFIGYVNPRSGISFGYPQDWAVTEGQRPLLARIGLGSALASIYLYRRTDLAIDGAGIEAARGRLISSLRRRAPDFHLQSSKITQINGALAIEIRGAGKVGARRVRTLAVHVYKPNGEYVVDAYAAPRQFDHAERIAFAPLLDTLRVRNPPAPGTASAP